MNKAVAIWFALTAISVVPAASAQKKAAPGKTDKGSTTTTTTSTTTTSTSTSTTTEPTTTTTTTTTTSTATSSTTGWPFQKAATCAEAPYSRLVNVSTATQLSGALANSRPGDKIQLADGVYNGRFSASGGGTPTAPIYLCGSRNAVINAGGTSNTGYALVLSGGTWVLDGFTITNAQQGMRLLGGRHHVVRRLMLYNIGQEAISLKGHAAQVIIEENRIYDVGRTKAEFGEGIYIGSTQGHWCTYTNCLPDRSDSAVVRNNVLGPNITREHVEFKEGVVGGYAFGNTIDNRGADAGQLGWMSVIANNVTIENNRATGGAVQHAFTVFNGGVNGGQNVVFRNNSGDASGATGFVFRIGGTEGQTSRIQCGQAITGPQSGYISYNIPCRN